jgi:hypothetical protein
MSSEKCLACGKRISWFRTFSGKRFCGQRHENQWLEELRQLTIERLGIVCSEPPKPVKARRPAVQSTPEPTTLDLALVLANR